MFQILSIEQFFACLDTANDFLWTYIVITLLIGAALYFSVRSRFVQLTMLRDMVLTILGKNVIRKAKDEDSNAKTEDITANDPNAQIKKIGSFQAFAISLSSRVGTGNLAGVASAIFVGGPGAIFWMWLMALFGAATAFAESTLAQLYKKRGKDSYYGGPAYYMQTGLKKKWMGVIFAILITITFGMANQVVQSNTLCESLAEGFGIDKLQVGIVLTLATLAIIFGGVHRISKFASLVVPFMAIGYIVMSLYVLLTHFGAIPHIFKLIIDSAFGIESAAGGAIGITVMQGIKRGLFSNEAGEGSAPNAAAIASTSHPIKQGLIQALGVFTDTIIVCSCTAFLILLSGKYDCGKDGILLTTEAANELLGNSGRYFITIAIFFFAYSTIIANYFYGETNVRFISHKPWPVFIFRIITGITVLLGGILSLQMAWSLVDMAMGCMTVFNLIAILLLSNKVILLLRNYKEQKRAGKEPTFRREMLPDIQEDLECW